MDAVDPTYLLYPIACLLASAMLLLVLTTSFVRQSWNLGVTFLCFWLFLELVTFAVNAIVWSDNADVKLYVYCDIVSHLQLIVFVVKPMATVIITRRLYLIASLQSVQLPNKAARYRDLALEWTLGLIIPVLVAGPIYYVNQGARFRVLEGLGCKDAEQVSILDTMILESWTVVCPLISIVFYYPKVARTYYRQRRDIDSFLRSNSSVSRTNYIRILILASIDILLTLPIGIVNLTLDIVASLSAKTFPFYPGWTLLHANWDPQIISYADLQAGGPAELSLTYFAQWTSPVLAFAIFGLFGVTPEAGTSYWRIICTVGGWFGWKPIPRARNGQASLGDIEFGARPVQDTSGIDLEMGSRPPSFINTDVHAANQGAGNVSGAHATPEETDLKACDETRREFTSDAVSQDSIKNCAQTVGEPSNVVETSSIVSVHTHVVQGQDTANSVGGNTTRELHFDHTGDIVSDVHGPLNTPNSPPCSRTTSHSEAPSPPSQVRALPSTIQHLQRFKPISPMSAAS
ncbi:STE3-domain-containing protein [Peniophora sp. CONT]|nr:STE3-domain-containing protein [Peniophora sp. CONT]